MFSIYDSPIIFLYFSVLALVLGLVLGSFLNCTAWRSVHGGSSLQGRSKCPTCGHTLGAADLVPVFSWLFLKGKCRYCGEKISVRYPLTELCFAALTLACLFTRDLTLACVRDLILTGCLFCLTLTDLDDQVIPDRFLIVPAIAWVVFLPWSGLTGWDILRHILAALVYGGGILLLSLAADRILKRDSLGGGDIKLIGLMGLYLGFICGLFSVMIACILGLLFAALRRRLHPDAPEAFPFGPAIALSFWAFHLWGAPLAAWYLSLLHL